MELQDKKYRILDIFFRLLKGEFVSMRQLADEYSHREKAYYLSMDDFLSSKELLVLIEILISSRALPKNSMEYYDYSVQSHSSTCDETKEDE